MGFLHTLRVQGADTQDTPLTIRKEKTLNPRTLCTRAGEPLTERDTRTGHTWCRDCREVDPTMYATITLGKRKTARRVDLAEANRLHTLGLNNTEIAKRLGVTSSSIGRALKRTPQ